MKNVKKLRVEKKTGNFFSANNKILLDSNLSDGSKILLIAILNDSDYFNVSEKVYCKRLNISKKTYHSRMKNLEENGYIRRTNIEGKVAPINGKGGKKSDSSKVLYFYTISEYGNLNNKPKEEIVENQTIKKGYEKPNLRTLYWDSPFGKTMSEFIEQKIAAFSVDKKQDVYENIRHRISNKFNEKFEEIVKYIEEEKNVIAKAEAESTIYNNEWVNKLIEQSIEIELKKK
jgi:DNA-binding Lrp family transcriptional regulator